MSFAAWLGFLLAAILIAVTPGPGAVLSMSTAIRHGYWSALSAILGLQVAILMHLAIVAVGFGALIATSETAFAVVKFLGAAYLAWLGFKMLVAKPGSAPVLHIRPSHYFQQAFAITLLNPKAIVFYMAFFPLFIDPARHQGLLTFGVMAATIAVLAFLYGLVVVLLTHFLAERLRASPVIGRVLEKIAGVFLIGFGVKLALSK